MGSKTIKGITVQLGGDTTGLDSALKDTNRESSKLQTELREVDRLLKLDPGNVILVQQKQDLLSQSVENTSDKLNTLKQAQEQVDEQFRSGQIDAQQYRAFQREIEKTSLSIKQAEKQLDSFSAENQEAGAESQKSGEEIEKAGKKAKGSGDDAEKGKSGWGNFSDKISKAGAIAGKAI